MIYLKLKHNMISYDANKVVSAVQSRWTKHLKEVLHKFKLCMYSSKVQFLTLKSRLCIKGQPCNHPIDEIR